MSNHELKERLGQLILDDDEFKDLENRLGGFCPFEALGVVSAEIRHSHFLSYLLSPFSEHGFGSLFLREMLTAISKESANDFVDRLELHLADLEEVDVYREQKARIDLLIVVHSLKIVVAIELKVDAAESKGQLGKYKTYVRQHWPASENWAHTFVYLTPDGRESSDPEWQPLAYEVITTASENVLASDQGVSSARSLLEHYITMLRRHHMEDERLQELARNLWKKHDAALRYLMDQAPVNGFSQYLIEWSATVPETCSTSGTTLLSDRITKTYINFGVKEFDAIPSLNNAKGWTKSGRMLLLELHNAPKSLTIKLVVGPGDQEIRDKVVDIIRSAGIKISSSKKWSTVYSQSMGFSPESLDEDDYQLNLKRSAGVISDFVTSKVEPVVRLIIGNLQD